MISCQRAVINCALIEMPISYIPLNILILQCSIYLTHEVHGEVCLRGTAPVILPKIVCILNIVAFLPVLCFVVQKRGLPEIMPPFPELLRSLYMAQLHTSHKLLSGRFENIRIGCTVRCCVFFFYIVARKRTHPNSILATFRRGDIQPRSGIVQLYNRCLRTVHAGGKAVAKRLCFAYPLGKANNTIFLEIVHRFPSFVFQRTAIFYDGVCGFPHLNIEGNQIYLFTGILYMDCHCLSTRNTVNLCGKAIVLFHANMSVVQMQPLAEVFSF